MSKPIFEDLFTFSGRRNRQSYIFLQLVSIVVVFVLLGLTVALGGFGVLVASIGGIAIAVANWSAASQRIRDFGQSGVWALAMLIPYVGFAVSLALWFVPSTEGENKYGPSCI